MSAFQVWNLVVTHSSRVDVKASNSSSDLFSFPIESDWRKVRISYGHHRIERHLNSACKKMKQFRLCLTLWRPIYVRMLGLLSMVWTITDNLRNKSLFLYMASVHYSRGVSRSVGGWFGIDSRKRSAMIALFSDGLARNWFPDYENFVFSLKKKK